MGDNGQRPGKPPPDPNLLAPNDYRRLRVALAGRDPDELLGSGQTEDFMQVMILAFKLRDDPAFTWEQAGDTPAGAVFDMTGGDREPDPPTGPPGSPGPAPAPSAASGSKAKRRGAAGARS
jgi:hypothetical protein